MDTVDDYHGTKVSDPYRWLEDDNSDETKAWVKAQNEVTFAFLKSVPQREAIKRRIGELWNYERFGLPQEEGGRYFFSRNSGLQNQSVYYVADALDAAPRELIDPNTFSNDGTVSLEPVWASLLGHATRVKRKAQSLREASLATSVARSIENGARSFASPDGRTRSDCSSCSHSESRRIAASCAAPPSPLSPSRYARRSPSGSSSACSTAVSTMTSTSASSACRGEVQ
jgi:hypothetical protein